MTSAITSRRKTDWSRCCLCQEDKKNEGLTSLSASNNHPDHDGYVMIATNVPLFEELGEMPLMFDPERLDEGSSIGSNTTSKHGKISQELQSHV